MNDSTPTDPTLTPVLRERQFWAAVLIGLPALIVGYILGVRLALDVWHDGLDIGSVTGSLTALGVLLTANPLTVYLAARQYPRAKAVEGTAYLLAQPSGIIDTSLDIDADDALAAAGEAAVDASLAEQGEGGHA